MGEPLMTRSAGNLISDEVVRNKRSAQWAVLPRAVRENRDYGSAVRVRFLAPIENAELSAKQKRLEFVSAKGRMKPAPRVSGDH